MVGGYSDVLCDWDIYILWWFIMMCLIYIVRYYYILSVMVVVVRYYEIYIL